MNKTIVQLAENKNTKRSVTKKRKGAFKVAWHSFRVAYVMLFSWAVIFVGALMVRALLLPNAPEEQQTIFDTLTYIFNEITCLMLFMITALFLYLIMRFFTGEEITFSFGTEFFCFNAMMIFIFYQISESISPAIVEFCGSAINDPFVIQKVLVGVFVYLLAFVTLLFFLTSESERKALKSTKVNLNRSNKKESNIFEIV